MLHNDLKTTSSDMTSQVKLVEGEPPVLSLTQNVLSVRMAAYLNQNNGALRHS